DLRFAPVDAAEAFHVWRQGSKAFAERWVCRVTRGRTNYSHREDLMATPFPIRCDTCREFMLLRWVIGRNQSYECPSCADRWAIVSLYRSGGVNSVRYASEKGATINHMAIVGGELLGTLLKGFFSRK